MKKFYLVLATIVIILMGGFFACNSAKTPSKNNEGLASSNLIISCSPH